MLFRQALGLRIRKSGSVAGPGIKIRAKVARIRVRHPDPANNGLAFSNGQKKFFSYSYRYVTEENNFSRYSYREISSYSYRYVTDEKISSTAVTVT